MTTDEVREMLKEAMVCAARVNTAQERPADKEILSKVLKTFGAEAMRNAARAKMASQPPAVPR